MAAPNNGENTDITAEDIPSIFAQPKPSTTEAGTLHSPSMSGRIHENPVLTATVTSSSTNLGSVTSNPS